MDYLAAPLQLNFNIIFVYYFQNFMSTSLMITKFTGFWSHQQKDVITHLKICAIYILVIVPLRPGFSFHEIVIHYCSYTRKASEHFERCMFRALMYARIISEYNDFYPLIPLAILLRILL